MYEGWNFVFKGTVKLYFFAEKDAPSVYKKRDVFIFPNFHL